MKKWQVRHREQLAHEIQARVGGSGKGIRRLLEQNCCKINGRIERFGSVWLEKGTVVEWTVLATAKKAEWTVLFENEFFQIVDKPTQWVCSEENCKKEFFGSLLLVHRLDKDTTGALLLAKNVLIRDELMALFAGREIEKEYIAIVDGVISEPRGTIENFLAKKGNFQGQTIWGSSSRGDLAITHWEVIARGFSETMVCCKPLTGRTHQLRVHLAEMGHPILTDRQYAKQFRSKITAARPLLHAHRLRFSFRGEKIDVESPLPEDMKKRIIPCIENNKTLFLIDGITSVQP